MQPDSMVPESDLEEIELIRVDQQAHRLFGPNEAEWTERQWSAYFTALKTVHADYPQNHRPRGLAA
jgi:hypothetical protein